MNRVSRQLYPERYVGDEQFQQNLAKEEPVITQSRQNNGYMSKAARNYRNGINATVRTGYKTHGNEYSELSNKFGYLRVITERKKIQKILESTIPDIYRSSLDKDALITKYIDDTKYIIPKHINPTTHKIEYENIIIGIIFNYIVKN